MKGIIKRRDKEFMLEIPPRFAKTGYSRAKSDSKDSANIALYYSTEHIRLIRAVGRGVRVQKRKPIVAIYNHSLQVVFSVEPVFADARAAVAKLALPPIQRHIHVLTILSHASVMPDEDYKKFLELFKKEERFTVQIYGPKGDALKAFEAFTVQHLRDKEYQLID